MCGFLCWNNDPQSKEEVCWGITSALGARGGTGARTALKAVLIRRLACVLVGVELVLEGLAAARGGACMVWVRVLLMPLFLPGCCGRG